MQGSSESLGLQKKPKKKEQEPAPGLLNQPVVSSSPVSGTPSLKDQAQQRGLGGANPMTTPEDTKKKKVRGY